MDWPRLRRGNVFSVPGIPVELCALEKQLQETEWAWEKPNHTGGC